MSKVGDPNFFHDINTLQMWYNDLIRKWGHNYARFYKKLFK